MWVVDFLRDVRDGREPQGATLRAFVEGAARGEVPDYQLSAFLMAAYHRGLSPAATGALTLAMRDSGHCIDLRAVTGRKVDKHSTGGVGDKVSLHLAPWVAACGVPVPMVAGRGLGHTGGTLDKLESIAGFRCNVGIDHFVAQLQAHGVCIMGQTAQLAPADRKLYALRDVTATVESIPLITASILSKKLAEGIDALVLDVKVGRGAFMKDEASARALATSLVRVGREAGVAVRALLTRMDAPLGRTIGNALEVAESVAVLRGAGPDDLVELSLALGAHMLLLADKADSEADARAQLLAARADGRAWAKFRAMVQAQGGDVAQVDDPRLLPQARFRTAITAHRPGYVVAMDGYALGHAAMAVGAGRSKAEDAVDPAVGVVLAHPLGAQVGHGETLAVVHHNAPLTPDVARQVQDAIELDGAPPEALPAVIATIDA